jgi:hypothetical protein
MKYKDFEIPILSVQNQIRIVTWERLWTFQIEDDFSSCWSDTEKTARILYGCVWMWLVCKKRTIDQRFQVWKKERVCVIVCVNWQTWKHSARQVLVFPFTRRVALNWGMKSIYRSLRFVLTFSSWVECKRRIRYSFHCWALSSTVNLKNSEKFSVSFRKRIHWHVTQIKCITGK